MNQSIGSGAYQCEMQTSWAYTSAEDGVNAVIYSCVCICINPLVIYMLSAPFKCPLAYSFLSMKLSITPAEVSGYSLRTTSPLAIKVLG